MDYAGFRNTMRQWVRGCIAEVPALAALPLYTPNETDGQGVDTTYLRYSLQTGEAAVIGVGTAIKRRRRIGRLYIEVFSAIGDGEGETSALSTSIEAFIRKGTDAAFTPHQDITLWEPSTFDRPEAGRYCQVVNARVQVDLFS